MYRQPVPLETQISADGRGANLTILHLAPAFSHALNGILYSQPQVPNPAVQYNLVEGLYKFWFRSRLLRGTTSPSTCSRETQGHAFAAASTFDAGPLQFLRSVRVTLALTHLSKPGLHLPPRGWKHGWIVYLWVCAC